MKVISFPSAEHMPDILAEFEKENTNLGTVIAYLQTLVGTELPKSDEELKDSIDQLISVSSKLNKILQLPKEQVQKEYSDIFIQLSQLNGEIFEVDSRLNYSEYSPPIGQTNLFFIKTSLHSCLEGSNLIHKMMKDSFKPKYH